MRKNELFTEAMSVSGLQGQIEADFKGWGVFHISAADVIAMVAADEDVAPELLAVTVMNESTFRFYCEPNTNGSDDPYQWDVGMAQLNRGTIQRSIANQFISAKGIDIQRALDSTVTMFVGDPLQNLKLAARFLKRIGQGTIVGPSETVLYQSAVDEWSTFEERYRNERRAVAYTGPNARPARYQSWIKYAPRFQRFFTLYADV